ncbi:hypothetical protein Asppvi_010824 [Aspergillus pseudoviridinutans]|uniref:O-methyltransferase n=1 Tax=Aspergillus pseudoviridinutans TaxID=1517512 RepID=A0A9P3BK30_9EURO|nr:uncharacterized protein Asppvi_010824 [Aspergillus pseudoviridinutans]GIJ91849.1 hypothetical protein Asppvi_010824 [Aspergillus pseudoviridinutans]
MDDLSANATAYGKGAVIITKYKLAKADDLRETLKLHLLDQVDLLLLDIWKPMALPMLKLVQPKLKYGTVVVVDNMLSLAEGYKELLEYVRAPGSGFSTLTLLYKGGLEMSVYLPCQ